MTSVEEELAWTRAQLGPHWEVWRTENHVGPSTWSAKPVGATKAVCEALSSEELIGKAKAFAASLPKHIADTRAELEHIQPEFPDVKANKQKHLDALLHVEETRLKVVKLHDHCPAQRT